MKYLKFTIIIFLALRCSSCSDTDLFQPFETEDSIKELQEIEDPSVTDETNPNTEPDDDGSNNDSQGGDEEKTICQTSGGKADKTGLKTWCWGDIVVPPGGSNLTSRLFSDDQFTLNIECNPSLITREGDRLKFSLAPKNPVPVSWCNNEYNLRAEISTSPWKVNHPAGTEEWFGWSLTMGNNYKIDTENYWYPFQIHNGVGGTSPLVWIQVIGGNVPNIADGQLRIGCSAGGSNVSEYSGIFPQAGQSLDLVVHVIWGDENNGLLQVWVDGVLHYDKQIRTVMASNPVGGNAKWGIYKPNWRTATGVQSSENQGIDHLETYMGPLRIITRRPGDSNYGSDSYNQVLVK